MAALEVAGHRQLSLEVDPCAVCDQVCTHPGCWEASRKYVRQLIRLIQRGEYDPELIFRAQQEALERNQIKQGPPQRPTQKICNLNSDFGYHPQTGAVKSATEKENAADNQTDISVDSRSTVHTVHSNQSSDRSSEKIPSANNSQKSDEHSSVLTRSLSERHSPVKEPIESPGKENRPASPELYPTNKVDPLKSLKKNKKKQHQPTVMVWIAGKNSLGPESVHYREQEFVMTREGKAAVPNKNHTNLMLPPDIESSFDYSSQNRRDQEDTLRAGLRSRRQQNTTRVIPVQEEVINELLTLPKEILSQVLQEVTALDLLTPARTSEVIHDIISKMHNAKALQLSRIADECVTAQPAHIYRGEAKVYQPESIIPHSFLAQARLATRDEIEYNRRHRTAGSKREMATTMEKSKLSRVSLTGLPPLESSSGGLYNRSKCIRKSYPVDSPVQRGLRPIPNSPVASKPASRLSSASKLSQISAALATLPSSPYSNYRQLINRTPFDSEAPSRTRSAATKTPETMHTNCSWPINVEIGHREREEDADRELNSGIDQQLSLRKQPSVPPPSPAAIKAKRSGQPAITAPQPTEPAKEPEEEPLTEEEEKVKQLRMKQAQLREQQAQLMSDILNIAGDDDKDDKTGESLEDRDYSAGFGEQVKSSHDFGQNNEGKPLDPIDEASGVSFLNNPDLSKSIQSTKLSELASFPQMSLPEMEAGDKDDEPRANSSRKGNVRFNPNIED